MATLRRGRTAPLAALGAGSSLWALAALWLWRSRVPADLERPALDPGAFFSAAELERAESYERLVTILSLVAIAATVAALAMLTLRAPRLARGLGLGPIGSGVVVGMVTMLTVWAVDLPFGIVLTWWDRRHGLSRQDYVEAVVAPYAELFGLTVTALMTIAIVMALARRLGRWWWLAGGPAFAGIAVLFALATPYLLTAGLDEVSDPGLDEDVRALDAATGSGSPPVLVDEVSGETTLPNAMALGIGPSTRVVLWDTLLDGRFSDGEVRVVAAHELAHVARDHVWKGLAWFALFALPGALVIAEITRRRGGLGEPENVPLAALVLVLLQLALAPATNAITRHYEQEADWIALEATGDPDSASTLFERFARVGLAEPRPPSWSQALFGTHPALIQRMEMAEAWRERNR